MKEAHAPPQFYRDCGVRERCKKKELFPAPMVLNQNLMVASKQENFLFGDSLCKPQLRSPFTWRCFGSWWRAMVCMALGPEVKLKDVPSTHALP